MKNISTVRNYICMSDRCQVSVTGGTMGTSTKDCMLYNGVYSIGGIVGFNKHISHFDL